MVGGKWLLQVRWEFCGGGGGGKSGSGSRGFRIVGAVCYEAGLVDFEKEVVFFVALSLMVETNVFNVGGCLLRMVM